MWMGLGVIERYGFELMIDADVKLPGRWETMMDVEEIVDGGFMVTDSLMIP